MNMVDVGLLLLRLVVGGLLMAHGAQKLFGWFGGHGIAGTGQWMESMGMRPGALFASMAGAGEFFGGLLIALGFLNPLGPVAVIAVMAMAWAKAHWGKPIFVTEGGAELPLTNIAAALMVAFAGPGFYSLDHWFGISVPAAIVALAAIGAAATVVMGAMMRPAAAPAMREVPREQRREEEEPLRRAA